MAETGRKRQGELVRGVLEILARHPDGLQVAEVMRELEAAVPPTPFEASTYPNRPQVRRYEKIVRFSTIPSVKSGWLVKDKGLWSLTDEGRTALESFRDPERLMRESVRLYQAWKKTRPEPDEEAEAEEETVEAATTWEEAEDTAWTEIRSYVGQMPPYDFQHLVAALLRAMGYYVLWDAPVGPDGGDRPDRSFRSARDGESADQGAGKAPRGQDRRRRSPLVHGAPRRRRCRHLHLGRRFQVDCRTRGANAGEAADHPPRSQPARRALGRALRQASGSRSKAVAVAPDLLPCAGRLKRPSTFELTHVGQVPSLVEERDETAGGACSPPRCSSRRSSSGTSPSRFLH